MSEYHAIKKSSIYVPYFPANTAGEKDNSTPVTSSVNSNRILVVFCKHNRVCFRSPNNNIMILVCELWIYIQVFICRYG